MNNSMNNQINSPMGAQMQNPIPNPYFTNYAPVSAQTPFYSQPILQPAGMVYIINSPQELNTIPTQAGLNLYWCGNENKVFVRNFSGGAIEQKEYYLSTDNKNSNLNNTGTQAMGVDAIEDVPTELFDKLNNRLTSIERQIKNLKGGEPEWQI